MIENSDSIVMGKKVDESGQIPLRIAGRSERSIQPVHMPIRECPFESDHGNEYAGLINLIRFLQAFEPMMDIRGFLQIVAVISNC